MGWDGMTWDEMKGRVLWLMRSCVARLAGCRWKSGGRIGSWGTSLLLGWKRGGIQREKERRLREREREKCQSNCPLGWYQFKSPAVFCTYLHHQVNTDGTD